MRNRHAFSMLELVFVIVIMGIIGKFGTEFLAESYESFIFSKVNNTLQTQSTTAIEFVASRLQYRIRDSIIARNTTDDSFTALSQADEDYKMIEWVQTDVEGFRGITKPFWSSIIDLDNTNTNKSCLISPETNTSDIDENIAALTNNSTGFDDGALYFIGSNSDEDSWGWGGEITTQDKAMHPIKAGDEINKLLPRKDDFEDIDVYEYYKYSWSANGVGIENGNLMFYYNYQPWDGETYADGNKTLIMENVSTFRAMSLGAVVKIQICVKSDLVEEYSLCKEKTIF